MASIEKRNNNTWRLTVELGVDASGKRIRKRKTIEVEDKTLLRTTKKLREYLEDELVKFKMEVQVGEYIAPGKMSFQQFSLTVWVPKFAEKKYSPTTLKKYKGIIIRRLLPVFGHKQISEIKTMHLVSYISGLYEGEERKDGRPGKLSPHTILDIYKVLSNIFSKAKEWKTIKENPMAGVDRPVVDEVEQDFYDSEEAEKVIDALFQEPAGWRMYFLGAMLGGFRRGELTALEWSEVDFENNTFRINHLLH